MCGIVILPRNDHYQPMIAMWTRHLCTFIGRLMIKLEKNDKVSFGMTYIAMGFKGLSIHIAGFHS